MSKDYKKDISTAVTAAIEAGKYLIRNKNELNKLSLSDKKDTKLQADVSSRKFNKRINK